MPKISIITINYNNLEGLKRTVESVIYQTWQEFEYIIIDGGSTDGSAAYIENQSSHFDYWVSEPDKGIYNAMNKGILKSTGEYLLFLNSGDRFYDLEVLEKNQQEVCNADLVCFDLEFHKNETIRLDQYPKEVRFSHFMEGSIGHPSTFIKKELFEKFGKYNENLKIVSDWEFFINVIIFKNASYKNIAQTLSIFYAGGISSNDECYIERLKVLKENYSGLIKDYDELFTSRQILNTNRVKMLLEIEKSWLGKKMVSLFFKLYLFFSKQKLKDVSVKL